MNIDKNKIQSLDDLNTAAHIYFVGIAGISMCGLAEISHHLGYTVSGSDPRRSLQTLKLEELGIRVFNQQVAENITKTKPDLLVYSLAIPEDNEELLEANSLGIPHMNRAEYLGLITKSYKSVINIAGTHGKTTTTAMCSMILIASGANPTVHLGADLDEFDSGTVHLGDTSNLMVSEACEYKNALLSFYSTTAAILNIDEDHLDFFGNMDNIIQTFVQFAVDLPAEGNLVIPHEGENFHTFLEKLRKARIDLGQPMPDILTFGEFQENATVQANFYYKDLEYRDGLPHFAVYYNDALYRYITLSVPGKHNIMNALAAIACAHLNGGTPEAAAEVLKNFKGAGGRFTHVGTYRGAQVIADYAHHPTEIAATLEGASKIPHRKIWPICQILNYTRAKEQYEHFISVFEDYEDVIFYKIYTTRESDNLGMSAERFVDDILSRGRHARAANTVDELIAILDEVIHEEDLILFLGPEGIREVSNQVCQSEHGKFLHN